MASLRRVETRCYRSDRRGYTSINALCLIQVLASHTRRNIQVAATWGHVLTIAEENVAKETDDLVLTAVHPLPLQSQWWCQPN